MPLILLILSENVIKNAECIRVYKTSTKAGRFLAFCSHFRN